MLHFSIASSSIDTVTHANMLTISKQQSEKKGKILMQTKNISLKTFTMLLILTTAVSLIAAFPMIQDASATTLYPFITISPNPIGVGQTALLVAGFDFPTRGLGFPGFDGWTVDVTDPDGEHSSLGPFNADSTGLFSTTFVPSKIGNYTLKAHYPGGKVDYPTVFNVNEPAADTPTVNLVVQEEQITYAPGVPLPTNYWEFPIYGENLAWTNLAGNWLMAGYDTGRQFDWGAMSGAFNPYTAVPNTPHILWTKQNQFGGIVSGTGNYPWTYYTGSSYIRFLQPPVVINGLMYYKEMREPRMGWYCVNLATGETVYFNNGTYPSSTPGVNVMGQDAQISLGQILTMDTRNWHGGIAYLWSTGATTWAVWDAYTGTLQYTIKNAPVIATDGFAMTFMTDNTGALYTYQLDQNSSTMVFWNSSRMINNQVSDTFGNIGRERPQYNIDWKAGIMWNVSLPVLGPPILASVGYSATNITQVTSTNTNPTVHISTWDPKNMSVLILTNQTRGVYNAADTFEDMAVDGLTGQVMWRKIRSEGTWEEIVGGRAMSVADGIYTIGRKETKQLYAYNIYTGEKAWVTDARPSDWGTYIMGTCIAYGKVFWITYDGELWANDAKTGTLLWKFGPFLSGLEAPYGWYPFYGGLTVADGKVIVAHGEHSANSPLYKGEQMFCVNATDGTQIWRMPGWWQQPVTANGVVIAPNSYDGKIYTLGKGPTAVSVSAPDTAVTMGQSVVIKGTVMDNSVGTKQNEQAKMFPNGVPAVSDDSMTQWMEYVYQQKPMPTNTTGVTVSLDVIDSNGNFRNIGTAKTDASGTFSYVWTPDITGKYTLVASYAGSQSYWGSSTETAFAVSEAVAATSPPTFSGNTAPAEMYYAIAGSTIAIIVAIAIVGILLLRRRP